MSAMSNNYIERYWRDATPEDAIKEPPMIARFKNDCDKYIGPSEYEPSVLTGVDRNETGDVLRWFSSFITFSFNRCQVYDAPDPGEGWRLIDVDKEQPQVGDEIYYPAKDGWLYRQHNKPYDKELTYRRRIEQPKPEPKYVPFEWEDREQLRGRLITFVGRNRTVEFRCESFAVDDDGLIVNDAYADWLCKNAVFVDTKEPVGKKVQ